MPGPLNDLHQNSPEISKPPGRPDPPGGPSSRLQLVLEFVQEAPVGALGDDRVRGRIELSKLVQPASVEPQRLLRVELAPSIVAQVSQHLERVIVVLREAALDQLPSGTLPRVTSAAWRSSVRRPSLDPEVLGRDLDRALDHPNQVGVHALQPIKRQLAETKGHSTLPHQEGDHAGAGRGGR